MKKHLRRWGVVYFLAGLALVFNVLHWQSVVALSVYAPGQEPPRLQWWNQTVENLQSEVWQIWLACLAIDAGRRTKQWFQAKEDS